VNDTPFRRMLQSQT